MKKSQTASISLFVIMGIFIVFANSCKKDSDKDSPSENPTNGKTTAVFNPDVTYGTMTDQDGNEYKTVTIGTQTWMAENFRTTKYNDGSAIPVITGESAWSGLTTEAYCNYDNTSDNETIATYGRLYNWYAVNSGKLAPKGWHIPTDAEWKQLTDYLGGEGIAGSKLKESGISHWATPNTSANNQTGFTALPGGLRDSDGAFGPIDISCYWWSATESTSSSAWYRRMLFNGGEVFRSDYDKESGFYVRCLKD